MLPFPNTPQQKQPSLIIHRYFGLLSTVPCVKLCVLSGIMIGLFSWAGHGFPLSQHTALPLRVSLYRRCCVTGLGFSFVSVRKDSVNGWNLSRGWRIWSKALLLFFWFIKEKFLSWHYKMLNWRDWDWSDSEVLIYDYAKILLAFSVEETYWFTVPVISSANKTREIILPLHFDRKKTPRFSLSNLVKILKSKGP